MDFFSTLAFSSTLRPLRVVESNGVQWVLPDFRRGTGANRIVIERDAFTEDFLNLGQALLALMAADYYPGRYQAALEVTTMGSGDHAAFLDVEFGGVEGGNLLTEFFEKYGLPSMTDVFCTDYSGGVKHDILAEYVRTSIPEYGNSLGITGLEWPAAVLADFIIEIFLLSARPKELTERMRNAPRHIRVIERMTNLSYTVTFSIGQSGYERSCSVYSMFDYASLIILHDPHTVVRECPNCGRVFLPANIRAVYCCHGCQNSAASKRSQAKRAGKEGNEKRG